MDVCAILCLVVILQIADTISGPLQYIGCYKDEQHDRVMYKAARTEYYMTNEICVHYCKEKGFPYAATFWLTGCSCGVTYDRHGPGDKCTTPCEGDKGQMCGGGYMNSVYHAEKLVHAWWKINRNQRLENHILQTIEASHKVACERACDGNELCFSFNFHAAAETCELSDKGNTAITDAVAQDGWEWLVYNEQA